MADAFPENPVEFCVTDVGSTTTKAILFSKKDRWSYLRAEAPTTVEKPHADVTLGVRRAFAGLERLAGRRLLEEGRPCVPYLSTSSAGGGLAMIVTGLVRELTSRSAERVALGAGAILLDVIAMDDARTPYEKILALKSQRPDMVLLAGGFDGDAISGPVFLGEVVREAGLRPKLNPAAKLTVLYAGNRNAADYVRETLGDGFRFHAIDNIRPASLHENLEPARAAIQDLFMRHVMSQAPGYDSLLEWTGRPVLPTPLAFGKILALASRKSGRRILAVDIGGATTDVFTAAAGEVTRTVSANLGMSYSLLNVVEAGGLHAVAGAFAHELSDLELMDALGGKHIRPTRLPATARELDIEWAAAAVAVREAVREHLQIVRGRTISRQREDLDIRRFLGAKAPRRGEAEKPDLAGYDLIIGSGGILSHSPRRAAAKILDDALRPPAATELTVDSAFMFPHLGVLSEAAPELALELYRELGLVPLVRNGDGVSTRGHAPAQVDDLPRANVERGELRLTRELAVPGELFVKTGQRVEPDTVIARSTRQFLRPFYLEIARVLEVEPGEAGRYLLKRMGDEIKAGDLVALRERSKPFGPKKFVTQVSGRIERLLPSGTLVVREDAQEARRFSTVNVAKELRIDASKLAPYLKVAVGDSLERGQWIAAMIRADDRRICRSPVRGVVADINPHYGIVAIEPLLEALEVAAWLPGTVAAVTDRGCVVAGAGARIEGIWGRGGEVAGELTLGAPGEGRIVARDAVDAAELKALAAAGVAGLIAGGVHLKDVLDQDPLFTIVVTEGFGDPAMSPEIMDALRAREGGLALLDGTTELRVGVRRPVALLPDR